MRDPDQWKYATNTAVVNNPEAELKFMFVQKHYCSIASFKVLRFFLINSEEKIIETGF